MELRLKTIVRPQLITKLSHSLGIEGYVGIWEGGDIIQSLQLMEHVEALVIQVLWPRDMLETL